MKPERKGAFFEELLREYFLRSNYFAVRGVKIEIGALEATDVDLWLYMRSSSISRERINVDARDRKRAGAAERLFWARGVQVVLGLDRCILATTERRPEFKAFAQEHGVRVLDGAVLARLSQVLKKNSRLTEEEFEAECFQKEYRPLLGDARLTIKHAKSRLLTKLDFDGCNAWLKDIEQFARAAVVGTVGKNIAIRLMYFTVALLLIGIDYSIRLLAFDDAELMKRVIAESFRFGKRGRTRFDEALGSGVELLAKVAPDIRSRLESAKGLVFQELLSGVNAELLADYFHRSDVQRDLFTMARKFESYAYAKDLIPPKSLDPQLSGVLAMLVDYFGMDRASLLSLDIATGQPPA